jgi:glyoxylase I family protein
MSTPTFAKVSHISFSVRDAEASARWWRQLFALEDLDRAYGDGWTGILLIHPATATIVEFQQHDANGGERFNPARTGFDHMGFKVDSRTDLDDWQAHFKRFNVDFTPIVDREYGSVLTFRDPDGIQFEIFYRENHP